MSGLQTGFFGLFGLFFCQKCFISLLGDKSAGVTNGSQPQIRVILPQKQAEFRPGCHHAVGLVGALGHQVVNESTDVAPRARQSNLVSAKGRQGGVDTRHQTLGGGLLVARGAVELSRAVESWVILELQGGVQLGRIGAIVLNGVGVSHDLCVFKALEGSDHLPLHVGG